MHSGGGGFLCYDTCMDIVCLLRGGENHELRYALRSWEENVEFDNLWIVGSKPEWLVNVNWIPGNPYSRSIRNVWHNVKLSCMDGNNVPPQFLMMNDDFFVLEPLPDPLPAWYRGLLQNHFNSLKEPNHAWGQSLNNTQEFLNNPDSLSYELHVPFLVDKARMSDAQAQVENDPRWSRWQDAPPQWRTIQNNVHPPYARRIQRKDVKVLKTRKAPKHLVGLDLLSTDDNTFPAVRGLISARFPKKSRFEL